MGKTRGLELHDKRNSTSTKEKRKQQQPDGLPANSTIKFRLQNTNQNHGRTVKTVPR